MLLVFVICFLLAMVILHHWRFFVCIIFALMLIGMLNSPDHGRTSTVFHAGSLVKGDEAHRSNDPYTLSFVVFAQNFSVNTPEHSYPVFVTNDTDTDLISDEVFINCVAYQKVVNNLHINANGVKEGSVIGLKIHPYVLHMTGLLVQANSTVKLFFDEWDGSSTDEFTHLVLCEPHKTDSSLNPLDSKWSYVTPYGVLQRDSLPSLDIPSSANHSNEIILLDN